MILLFKDGEFDDSQIPRTIRSFLDPSSSCSLEDSKTRASVAYWRLIHEDHALFFLNALARLLFR